MNSASNPSRVVAIGDPGPAQQQITTALQSQAEFQLAGILSLPEKLLREIGSAKPDIILIEHQLAGQPTVDIIDDIAREAPQALIVAILPDHDPVQVQRVLLAGARAFLTQPFTQINLLSTLRRVCELESRRSRSSTQPASAAAARPIRALSVFSPRGGVGCSFLAANLALAFQELSGQKVLLLEGKQFFGHLDVFLNIRTHNTLAELIPHAGLLDEAIINDVVVEHGTGIHVLLGPRNLHIAQGLRPDDLYSIFVGLQHHFDLVVIDAGSTLSENIVTFLDAADQILLVTSPELASLHDVTRFVQISHSLSYKPEKILTVLNREGIQGGVATKDIEMVLRHSVFARIPEDSPDVLRSLNQGVPLLVKHPRSPASKAVKQLASTLSEVKLAEPARAASQSLNRVQREALLASSQFG